MGLNLAAIRTFPNDLVLLIALVKGNNTNACLDTTDAEDELVTGVT